MTGPLIYHRLPTQPGTTLQHLEHHRTHPLRLTHHRLPDFTPDHRAPAVATTPARTPKSAPSTHPSATTPAHTSPTTPPTTHRRISSTMPDGRCAGSSRTSGATSTAIT